MKHWRYINSVWSSRKNILWNIQYSISAATIWSVCTIKDRYYQLSLLNRCLSDISWRIGLLTRRRDRRTFSKERSVRHREIMEWKKTNTGHIIHPYESVYPRISIPLHRDNSYNAYTICESESFYSYISHACVVAKRRK